jgi:Glycine rich protein
MKRTLVFALSLFLGFNVLSTPSASAVLSNPTPVCVSGNCTINFDTTNDYYLWSAPTTGTYTFQVWGAQGGSALNTNGTVAQTGPLGGYSAGNYSLTSGQAVYVYVGGQGSGSNSVLTAVSGGFNGGGVGYNGSASGRAAGGGGASDIRIGGNAFSNRVIVAGGGGGGKLFTGYGNQSDGYGGGTSGASGNTSNFSNGWAGNGGGGTQSAGGAGGRNGGTGGAGTLGIGGNGISSLHEYGSSGGGGGFYGGGGAGVGMSPGGGSGYVGGVTSSTITAGDASMPNPAGGNMVGRSGNGFIRITYTFDSTPPAFTLFELASGTTRATFRSAVVITATVTLASRVTFKANGKVLPGCINKTAVGSGSSFTVTCSWKPSLRGSVALRAIADPIADGIANTTSSQISVGVSGRTGRR